MSFEDFKADVKVEGDTDPFAKFDKESTTSSESLTEKKQEEVQPGQGEAKPDAAKANTDDENLPFHKHPRWIERENELKALKESGEATQQELAELRTFKQQIESKFKGSGESNAPEWFKKVYGDDPQSWEEYQKYSAQERQSIKEELRKEAEAERQQAKAQEEHWNKWVQDELGKLEASGKKFNRNELLKVMMETRPTDQNGNFDFEAGYRIYELQHQNDVDPARSQARKQIADAATRPSRGEPKRKDYMTPADLRNTSWNKLS